MKKSIPFIFSLISSLLILYPLASYGTFFQCLNLFRPASTDSTYAYDGNPLMMDLNQRVMRVETLLKMATPLLQRQWKKKLSQLKALVREFVDKGDLSEKKMNLFLQLGDELSKVEQKLIEMESFFQLDPSNFLRVLLTQEPILADFEYRADLPGFGEVVLKFNDETSKFLNSSPQNFNLFVPNIFNGVAVKTGADGIKGLNGEHTFYRDENSGIEFKLMELKNVTLEYRIIVIHSSEGFLYFTRIIKNHKRIEHIAKGRFLQNFIQTLLF